MDPINLKEIARDHRLECETYNTELKNITLWGCALLLNAIAPAIVPLKWLTVTLQEEIGWAFEHLSP